VLQLVDFRPIRLYACFEKRSKSQALDENCPFSFKMNEMDRILFKSIDEILPNSLSTQA